MQRELLECVGQIVRQHLRYGAGSDLIDADSALIDQGLIDSMGLVSLIASLEARFDIDLIDDLYEHNFETIAAIARMIARRQMLVEGG